MSDPAPKPGSGVAAPAASISGAAEDEEVSQGEPIGAKTGRVYHLVVYPCARWSKTQALCGEEVELVVKVGPRGGTGPFELEIWERDEIGADDLVDKVTPEPRGEGKVVGKWKVRHVDDSDDVESAEELEKKGYTLPEYYFVVKRDGTALCDSGTDEESLLRVLDVIDRPIHDGVLGEPVPGARYELTLADGTKREGTLDDASRLYEENVPPGPFWIRLETGTVETFDPGASEVDLAGFTPLGEDSAAEPPEPDPGLAVVAVAAHPRQVEEGKPVELRASVVNARDGDEVRFRIFKLGGGESHVAEVSGPVRGGVARATWVVAGARGGGKSGRFAFADFDVEAGCGQAVCRTHGIPELRGFAREG